MRSRPPGRGGVTLAAGMLAYKVLHGGSSMFSGFRWPLPDGAQPGAWVTASGPLALCGNGIHASTIGQLPQWLGDEIWEIELDGEIVEEEPALVAERARLLRRVSEWDEDARRGFAQDCAARAEEIVRGYPAGEPILREKIDWFVPRAMAAPAGYWTALLKGESVTGRRRGDDYDRAFAGERAEQARCLRGLLSPRPR